MAVSILTTLVILSLTSAVLTQVQAAAPNKESPPPQTWALVDSRNISCILVSANIRMSFNLTDEATNKTYPELRTTDVPPGNETVVEEVVGSCDVVDNKQKISLTFNTDWMLNVTFTRNTTSKKYSMSDVALKFNTARVFPNAQVVTATTSATLTAYETDLGKKFICTANQNLYSKPADTPDALVDILTQSLTFEAFRNETAPGDKTFSNQFTRCSADEVSQLVPIIVGACLVVLIVVVLVAYLIGRRFNRRGYESV
jgi:hypothetical protein